MNDLAILGASSQIAKDLIVSLTATGQSGLQLYVRDLDGAARWLEANRLGQQCALYHYADYGRHAHNAVFNFVGVGDPQRAAAMGGEIFTITQQFDDLVMDGLRLHPQRRYIFLSSGAAYGSTFLEPARADTPARIAINALPPQEYYAVAKLHAEARHRAHPELAITDLRVFNYFSRTQDLAARFFITDILRAIRDGSTLYTSADYMVRDFLHPSDFHRLVTCVLAAPARNQALDCYTSAPVDKPALLAAMQAAFGLDYEIAPASSTAATSVNATGAKPHYYSLHHQAAGIGYVPAHSSLDGVLLEAAAILGRGPGHSEAPRENAR